jgi:hypothetical protein
MAHMNKFLILLTSINEKKEILDICIKFGRNVFHFLWKKTVKSRRGIRFFEEKWKFAKVLGILFVFQKNCIMKIKGSFMRVVLWKETIEHPFLKPKFKNGICNDSVQIS